MRKTEKQLIKANDKNKMMIVFYRYIICPRELRKSGISRNA